MRRRRRRRRFCGSSWAVWRQEGLELRREMEATYQHGQTGKNKIEVEE
jgi:hypothetical protein